MKHYYACPVCRKGFWKSYDQSVCNDCENEGYSVELIINGTRVTEKIVKNDSKKTVK